MQETLAANSLLLRRWCTSRIRMGENNAALIAAILLLAAVYFVSSKLGFTMAHAAEQITVVWPPTGISIAAVLLLGYRVWPGIALGAFLTNVTANEPVLTAAMIAVGNTLESVVGVWMLRRFMNFNNALPRIRDVLGFAVFCVLLGTMISATIGVASLCLGGVQQWPDYWRLWLIWWVGDATGALIFAPVLLVLANGQLHQVRRHAIDEELALIIGLSTICVLVFIMPYTLTDIIRHMFTYLIFPFIVWAALRFGHLYTTFVTFVVSCTAIWATTKGLGPFTTDSVGMNLFLLQVFMGAMAMTGLLLGAAVSENSILAQQQHGIQTVSQIVGGSQASHDTIYKTLQILGICSRSDYVAFWLVDAQANTIRCINTWHNPLLSFPGFDVVTRNITVLQGTEIAGQAWMRKTPLWLPDMTHEKNEKRAQAAVSDGLYSVFAFPVIHHNRVAGVLEFFSHERTPPDKNTLSFFNTAGNMLAQFLELVRTKQSLSASEARNSIFE